MIKSKPKGAPTMFKIIATIMLIALIVINLGGSHAKKEKHVADFLIIGRVCLFVLLTTSVIHLILHLHTSGWFSFFWLLYMILINILVETTFRLKRETFGNPARSSLLTVLLVVALIIAVGWL